MVTTVLCWPINITWAVPGDAGHGDAEGPTNVLDSTTHGTCSVVCHSRAIDVECPFMVVDGPSISCCSVALKGAAIDVECPRVLDGPSLLRPTILQSHAVECECCIKKHTEESPLLLSIANGSVGMDSHILTSINVNSCWMHSSLTILIHAVVAVEVRCQCDRA